MGSGARLYLSRLRASSIIRLSRQVALRRHLWLHDAAQLLASCGMAAASRSAWSR